MRYLIITDVHGNLPALEAVLDTPEARSCHQILSLGDQINYGPQPRQVVERLRALGAVMLLGNHEERLSHLQEPAFQQYNWAMLHWSAQQAADVLPSLPPTWQEGSVLCTHACPGDVYGLLWPDDLPGVLDTLPEGVTHLITGHNHIRWRVEHRGRLAVNPGALGMLETAQGGIAPFAVLDMGGPEPVIACHAVPYDTEALTRAFVSSGCWKAAPEMSRIALTAMRYGYEAYPIRMVRRIMALCQAHGLSFGSREGWQLADAALPWREEMSTEAYWKKLERENP